MSIPTAAELQERCTPEGNCLLWDGALCNGSPQVYATAIRGAKGRTYQCRRIIFEAMHGPLEPGKYPVMTCRDRRCLNHEHMEAMTVKQIQQLASAEGKFSTPSRRAAISAARRKNGKLNHEKVQAILAARTATEAAAAHGIHRSMAARIRRGEAWAEVRGASAFTYRP